MNTTQFTLEYKHFRDRDSRADITIIEPGALPPTLWPGCRVVIYAQPSNPEHHGWSVTNGANVIVHELLVQGHVTLEGSTVYVEHWGEEGMSEHESRFYRKPSFDVFRFKWEVVRCTPPYKMEARLNAPKGYWWHPVPVVFYPVLLDVLKEPIPVWLSEELEGRGIPV